MPFPDNWDEMSPEEQREWRAEQARLANQNRNTDQLNRRNAIADAVDEGRDPEMQGIDGDRILPKGKKAPAADAQDTEDQARQADEEAETERARLEAEAEGGPGNQDPTDDDDGEEDDDTGTGGPEEGDSKVINGETYYALVVNGKQKWLTLPEIRKRAQKVESADEYLQQAADSVKRAAHLEPSPTDVSGDDEAEIDALASLYEKASMGDKEAIRELARIQSRASKTPDLAKTVDQRVIFLQAVEWFRDEFQDELKDPDLRKMIEDEDERLASASPGMSYKHRLKAAGEKARKFVARIGGKPTGAGGSDTPTLRNKAARKQRIANQPSAGGGRAGDRREPEEEETVSDAINKMAKARNQARAIQH